MTATVTQPLLLTLCAEADEKGYNRRLDTDVVAANTKADDTFDLIPVMVHEHVAGEYQTPDNWQMRCTVSEYGKNNRIVGFLDVNICTWQGLA
jgi:hypothetical protein